jgi:putative membrane protein
VEVREAARAKWRAAQQAQRHDDDEKTYAVSVDILGNVWVEHLGGKVTSLVSTRLAEGIVAAVRVARLGLPAMEGCRPMSFSERDRPGLLKLREQIMKWEF